MRTTLLAMTYSCLIALSFSVAYLIGFDFVIHEKYIKGALLNFIWYLPFKLAILAAFGQFRGLIFYFRMPDLIRVFWATMLTAAFMLLMWFLYGWEGSFPRRIIFLEATFSLLLICSFRLALRKFRERLNDVAEPATMLRRVAIVGAGDRGESLAADLLSRRGLGLEPVVFLDDDPAKQGRAIHGISVRPIPENFIGCKQDFSLDRLVIAANFSPERIERLLETAHKADLEVDILPERQFTSARRATSRQLRPVDIEDLLGRPPADLNSASIGKMLQGRVVMVTGGGGSIGSELCQQVLSYMPTKLLVVEQSELQLYEISNRLDALGFKGQYVALIADVLDTERMRWVCAHYQPQIIFHAAAHKHVPIMELQPTEAFKNNVLATQQLALLAMEFKVERFVLISTDKAINPTSVMGVSKRLAERVVQAFQQLPNHHTTFLAVRFGNVLGSSGSVIPLFKQQIAAGGPVTVTHPDMVRYFMTIPEAVGLVLQSALMGKGGEVFLLNMGEPIKILDLARRLIRMSGFIPERDIDIEFTGIRPGEKLFEELAHDSETASPTEHDRIMLVRANADTWATLEVALADISEACQQADTASIKQRLQKHVPEYQPYLD